MLKKHEKILMMPTKVECTVYHTLLVLKGVDGSDMYEVLNRDERPDEFNLVYQFINQGWLGQDALNTYRPTITPADRVTSLVRELSRSKRCSCPSEPCYHETTGERQERVDEAAWWAIQYAQQ